MLKRALLLLAILMLGCAMPILTLKSVAAPSTLRVPTDFPTIQSAVDAANPGDTIFVFNGTYHERILVNKTLIIVGQTSDVTTIDGDGLGTVVNITASEVSFSNFTIRNSGPGQLGGVSLSLASDCSIFGNNIISNGIGLLVDNSSENRIFHNNFVGNTVQVLSSNSSNVWDDGYPSGGNYWSSYIDADVKRGTNQDQPGSDGIIDSPYQIDTDNSDRYPFGAYWRPRIVKNMDTGISYDGIQKAIDATETSSGNTIHVYVGVFYENVVVTKHIHLVGENSSVSIIDGGGVGNVVSITSASVSVSGFTLRNSGSGSSDSAVFINGVSSVTIAENVLASSSVGISLDNSRGCTVQGNVVSHDVVGVDLDRSSGNTLRTNNITSESDAGLLLSYSDDNTIEQNMMQTVRDGFRMENCFGNRISQNIVVDIASYAVHLSSSGSNEFSGNKITSGYVAFIVENGGQNMIAGNEVSYNRVGVDLIASSNNTIYYNNFLENDFQVQIDAASGSNNWNMSYPLGGNFWSSSAPGGSYSGVDEKSGKYQNETGSDGIGDTPYTPDTTSLVNKDYYPQMHAVSLTAAVDVHDVGLKNIFVSSDRIYRGGVLNVTVLVSNFGNYTETFSVTAYYNASLIALRGVSSLLPRSDLNLTFVWNTTGLNPGKYTLSANATVVSGEENVGNNKLVGATVTVGLYRDVAVTSAVVSSNAAYEGRLINITALISNLGETSENLTVRAAYDGNLIGTRTVNSLSAHANASVVFTWNTSGAIRYHTYNITVQVDPIPDEAVSGNNVLSAGLVSVRIMGDVNGDRVVNIVDISAIAIRYGSKTGDSKYELVFDLNSDGVINIVDVAMAAVNFRRTG